jgi:hypothetical protein
LGDCWLLAGLASLAARNDRLTSIFANKDLNYPSDGKVRMKVRVLNEEKIVTIDDFIPVSIDARTKKGTPIFARGSKDSDYWGALAEKGFAKVFGTYTQLAAGDS